MEKSVEETTVFQECPELKRLYAEQGDKALHEYLTEKNIREKKITDEELIQTVKRLATTYIDQQAGNEAEQSLRENFTASMADHHGILCHPFSFHALLIKKITTQKPIIAFPCAGISLDNSSYPRGIFWHTEEGPIEKLIFHGYKNRHMSVFSAPSVSLADIEKKYMYADKSKQEMLRVLQTIWRETQQYRDQVSYLTYQLSKKIWNDRAPVIFIDQESITLSLIQDFHLDKGTIIEKLLCDKKWHEAFRDYFENKRGAFSNEKGTFLFWYMNPNTRVRERLVYKNGYLKTQSGWNIELKQEELRVAIKSGVLMPSMALSFIVLCFYYGLTTPGGFLQIQYLGELKEAWVRVLLAVEVEVPTHLTILETNKMGGDFGVFWGTFGKQEYLLSLGDLLLTKTTPSKLEHWLESTAKKATVAQGIDGMMQEYIKILTGKIIASYEIKREEFQRMPSVRE